MVDFNSKCKKIHRLLNMIFKKNKRDLYLKASKVSLNNSEIIYHEAKSFVDQDHYARGFALGAISLEESAKSFLFRLISLDHYDEDKTIKSIYDHEVKYKQSSLIQDFSSWFVEWLIELIKISQNHGWIETNISVPSDFKQKIGEYIKIIKTPKEFEKRKNNALYVGIDKEKIIDPNNSVSKNDVLRILDVAEMQNGIVKAFINAEDSKLLEICNDPLFSKLKIDEFLKSNEPTFYKENSEPLT